MAKWITAKEGVRYREHHTRKHGVNYDRYYVIRYRDADGVRKEESLGWSSKKGWTTAKAVKELHRLKANHTTGTGAQSLKDSRALKKQERAEIAAAKKQEAISNLTFSDVFKDYLTYSQANKRSAQSWKREEQLSRLHIVPVVKNLPLRKIALLHLERLKKNMSGGGSSARSIRYALATVRQVFNYAMREGLYNGPNPASGSKVLRPKEDNKKTRYLSRDEADRLLKALAARSTDIHDMSLLSLYTGMRFSEVAALRWADVDLFQGVIMLKNTKSAKNRPAYITPEVKKMLTQRNQGKPEDLIFQRARGDKSKPRPLIGNTYYHVVRDLFNKDLTDKKLRVDFHTLRHTFASWLVEDGTDLYLVKELLGHSDLKITERYAHIGENQLRQAVMRLQK